VVFSVAVNTLAAALALGGGLFYVFIYTMLLKRRTPLNIVIGGAAGAFPPLAGDPAVLDARPQAHIGAILHGLHGKAIKGTAYASQMPPFAQLSDNDIAAIVDHERTSWGNAAPTINPDDVKRARSAK